MPLRYDNITTRDANNVKTNKLGSEYKCEHMFHIPIVTRQFGFDTNIIWIELISGTFKAFPWSSRTRKERRGGSGRR